MACACQGVPADDTRYLVTFADGTQKVARTEPSARVAVTMAGGGTWVRITTEQAAGYQEV